jgi:hypothetical protein
MFQSTCLSVYLTSKYTTAMHNLSVRPWASRLLSANNVSDELWNLPLADTADSAAHFLQDTDSDTDVQPRTEPGKPNFIPSYTICYILKGITH